MKTLMIASLLVLNTVSFAAKIESPREKAQYPDLYQYIDTYDWEEVFSLAPARAELAHLLSADQRATLKANLKVRVPIEFISGFVIVKGQAPSQGFDEAAMVAIAPADGQVFVSISHQGRVTNFGRGADIDVPLVVQEWANQAAGDESKVRFVGRP